MSYSFHGSNFHGFFDTVKNTFDPPKEPPPEMEAPEPEEVEEEDLDPASYVQDPNCPEGQRKEGEACVDDPAYLAMVAELEAELAQIDAAEKAAAERAAKAAKRAEARELLRKKMEAQRIADERRIAAQRAREEEQMKKLAVYGIGGLGVLTVVTILVKMILKK